MHAWKDPTNVAGNISYEDPNKLMIDVWKDPFGFDSKST